MTEAVFWNLIGTSKLEAKGDLDGQVDLLQRALEQQSEQEILDFDRLLHEQMAESYSRDLWAAAYIINGGCSDDGFDYFRAWLIAQGQETFHTALANPESLVDVAQPDVELESLLYVAPKAFEAKTKNKFPYPKYPQPQLAGMSGKKMKMRSNKNFRSCLQNFGKPANRKPLNEIQHQNQMTKNSKLIAITGSAMSLLVAQQGAVAQAESASTNSPTQMPEIIVTGSQPTEARPGWLQEEQPVGPYQQPEWTTARRFPGTRIYLQQVPWGTGFEQWVRFRHYPDGSTQTRFQEEFEIGLPYRFQLDLYETWSADQNRRIDQNEVSAEVRYALADWGKIPLNPTLYLEYAQHSQSEPNTLEGKILLGTDFTPRWHWGMNLICEQELSGSENTSLGVSQGISYSLVDERLGAGVEMEYSHDSQGNPKNNFLIGPSVQWRPTSRLHIDLSPLFGCTHDSPEVEAYLVIGFDFGTGQKEKYAPTSLRGQ